MKVRVKVRPKLESKPEMKGRKWVKHRILNGIIELGSGLEVQKNRLGNAL